MNLLSQLLLRHLSPSKWRNQQLTLSRLMRKVTRALWLQVSVARAVESFLRLSPSKGAFSPGKDHHRLQDLRRQARLWLPLASFRTQQYLRVSLQEKWRRWMNVSFVLQRSVAFCFTEWISKFDNVPWDIRHALYNIVVCHFFKVCLRSFAFEVCL